MAFVEGIAKVYTLRFVYLRYYLPYVIRGNFDPSNEIYHVNQFKT